MPLRGGLSRLTLAAAVLLLLPGGARSQDVRGHTRPTPDRSTAVSGSQADELTLTLTEASIRPIQIWVRTVGIADTGGTMLKAVVPAAAAALVKVGQRVRAFPPDARSRMYQARVTAVAARSDGALVTAVLAAPGPPGVTRYVLEVVTEGGEFLSVPNEAIIETARARLVYVQRAEGEYVPREIRIGLQGELFTQVLDGLKAGDRVVTFGSFFIDAEHKLKGS